LRLNEACHRLAVRDNSVEHIAASLGFKSAATFRRAFQRQLGIMPIDYRHRVARDGEFVCRLSHNPQKEGFSRAA
jgi:transcriptional regulator GlxA family with amidase domain